MPVYKTPNVYVEEISTLPPSVAGVSTAIPAFLGYTSKIVDNGVSLLNKPMRVSTFKEYADLFVDTDVTTAPTDIASIDVTITTDGDGVTQVDPINTPRLQHYMDHSLRMYFDNGGGPCYIVSVGDYDATIEVGDDDLGLKAGLNALALEDEPTLIVSADATFLDSSSYGAYAALVMAQCVTLQDRFGVLDVPIYDDPDSPTTGASFDPNVSFDPDITKDEKNFRGAVSGTVDELKYAATYYPYLETTLGLSYTESGVNVDIDGAEAVGLDTLSGTDTAIYNQVKAKLAQLRAILPPSPAMVGLYAKVDRSIGVWKAPANVPVASTIQPIIKISDADQEDLNVDVTAGKSINAIRTFTGKGVLVWGARTLAGNDNEWRYVPVRRLFIFVEESIQKATSFVVFEPNTATTWLKVSTLISSFLTGVWQQGGLAGASADQAFFVNVGLGTTMTSQDILEGRLIVEIGIAAVRPAEFIILRFSHKLQE